MLFSLTQRALSRWLLSLLCLSLAGQVAAQSAPSPKVAPVVARRQVAAQRTAVPIKLDGLLDDAAWATA